MGGFRVHRFVADSQESAQLALINITGMYAITSRLVNLYFRQSPATNNKTELLTNCVNNCTKWKLELQQRKLQSPNLLGALEGVIYCLDFELVIFTFTSDYPFKGDVAFKLLKDVYDYFQILSAHLVRVQSPKGSIDFGLERVSRCHSMDFLAYSLPQAHVQSQSQPTCFFEFIIETSVKLVREIKETRVASSNYIRKVCSTRCRACFNIL